MSREVKTADVLAGALRSNDVAGVSTAADFMVLDAEYADDLADAILAADPSLASALELGLAWLDVEAALPEKWMAELVRQGIRRGDVNPHTGVTITAYEQPYRAVAAPAWPVGFDEIAADGPTPQAALRALHDRLQSRGE